MDAPGPAGAGLTYLLAVLPVRDPLSRQRSLRRGSRFVVICPAELNGSFTPRGRIAVRLRDAVALIASAATIPSLLRVVIGRSQVLVVREGVTVRNLFPPGYIGVKAADIRRWWPIMERVAASGIN